MTASASVATLGTALTLETVTAGAAVQTLTPSTAGVDLPIVTAGATVQLLVAQTQQFQSPQIAYVTTRNEFVEV